MVGRADVISVAESVGMQSHEIAELIETVRTTTGRKRTGAFRQIMQGLRLSGDETRAVHLIKLMEVVPGGKMRKDTLDALFLLGANTEHLVAAQAVNLCLERLPGYRGMLQNRNGPAIKAVFENYVRLVSKDSERIAPAKLARASGRRNRKKQLRN